MNDMNDAWLLLAVAFAATYGWRALGVLVARRIEVDMAIFEWFGCVTYALVGGLMVKAIFFATSDLATVPLAIRATAFIVGIAVFIAARRSVGAGFSAGVVVFAALAFWSGGGI